MNDYQTQLWHDLMALVEDSEAFYFQDFDHAGCQYRIFNYRLASYTEFMRPAGIECRGHMFQIDGEGYDARMLRLASLPPEKFWNLYECPATMDLDLTTVDLIEDKADGSLISTYIHADGATSALRLKSKGSLTSDQALAAMAWLDTQDDFKRELCQLAALGYTVNMEWVAPDNRIVLGYAEPELRVLNIRNTVDGSYLDRDVLHDSYYHTIMRWTERFSVDDPATFVAQIPDMQNIEGFVVRLKSGQRVKIKTTWYLALHHTKDNINSPRRLFEAVLEEATDDMKTLFHDDPLAIQTILEMEAFVEEKYNHMVDTVERFYERNKHLDRKDYAILGQQELAGTMYFGLAMNKYTGKEFSYKDFLKSKWKQLGLQDMEKDDE
jgi:RNA ligase